MSLLVELKAVLDAGGGVGLPVRLAKEPADPDSVVTVYQTGGMGPAPFGGRDRLNFQVRARGTDYLATEAAIMSARAKLCDPLALTTSEGRLTVWVRNDVQCIGTDDNDRWIFTLNLRVHREV